MDIKLLLAKGMKRMLNPPALRSCIVDPTSRVCSKSELTSVSIDRYTYVGNDCFMVNVSIGAFCSIADRVCIGGAGHPIERVSSSPVFHEGKNILSVNFQNFPYKHTPKTMIENDVWIGMGAIIKAGVSIHNGAVIGSGSIVTHDVPPYAIVGGNPARIIRYRFDENTSQALENIKWWEWDFEKIRKESYLFDDVAKFLQKHKS